MTKRYPFGGLLRRRDSRDPRHFQWIPFWIFQSPHGAHDARLHLHKTARRRPSCRYRFFRHVHHPHFAFLSVMRQLRHLCAPRLRLSSITPKHSRRSRSFLGLLASPVSSSPSPAPRYHPSLATLRPSLPALVLATPRARAKNASARAFPSKLPPAVPQPTAARAPPHRSTNQSPAPQTIQTSPSSKPDSPANRRLACLGTFRRRPASPAGLPPSRKRIPRSWLSAHFQPGRTFPSRRRLTARAHPLAARTRFSLPNPRRGPPHFPRRPARRRQFEPARQARRYCCFESETGLVFRRSKPLRPRWREWPRAAAARIASA